MVLCATLSLRTWYDLLRVMLDGAVLSLEDGGDIDDLFRSGVCRATLLLLGQ
jgi:hypothetical protein